MEDKEQQLKQMLEPMDIPEMRRCDLQWLSRNLGIANPNSKETQQLVQYLLRTSTPLTYFKRNR